MTLPLKRWRIMCVIKKGNSENNDKEKELGCLNDTLPDDMEEGISGKKNDKSEIMMREKRLNA